VKFLCGPHSAGKTELSKALNKDNYNCIELGKLVREIHTDLKVDANFHDWSVDVEKEHGPEYIDALILEKLKRNLVNTDETSIIKTIIVGARSLEIINRIKKSGIGPNNHLVVYIESTFEQLKERYIKRDGKEISDQKFRHLLRNDKTLGLSDIRENADIIIQNRGTLQEFLNKATSIITKN
jgi:dephospho-CoA kinase